MGLSAMVVDDSVIYRKAIARILETHSSIDSVVQASNGKEALRMYTDKPTDLVTLDVEMPLMTGLQVLPELLKVNPKARVMMISSITVRGAKVTLEALNLGATDFITKEQAFGLRDDQAEKLGESLNEKLSLLVSICKQDVISGLKMSGSSIANSDIKPLDQRPTMAPSFLRTQSSKSPVGLLLIGSSTGGPQTLQEVFKQLRPNRNYGVVIVQHMPPVFTAQLASNLHKVTGHHFLEAQDGLLIEKNMVVIAKGGYHLELRKNNGKWQCHLTLATPVNSCRPSVDVTFSSVAQQIQGPEVVAIMLTGMGGDGAQGSKALSDKKVAIITQEKNSCVVYGMPKAVDDLGIATSHAKPVFILAEAEKFMLTPEQI